MKINDIISQLSIKEGPDEATDKVTYYIGPESKYIRGLYRSNNRNFDEYYLLGTDSITTYLEESREINGVFTPVTIEEIKFYRNGDANNYYILKKEKLVVRQSDIQLVSEDDALSLKFDKENDMEYISELESIQQNNNNINIYVDEEDINIIGDTFYEHLTLLFIDESGSTINVSQKDIVSSTNLIDGIVKTITTETISEL